MIGGGSLGARIQIKKHVDFTLMTGAGKRGAKKQEGRAIETRPLSLCSRFAGDVVMAQSSCEIVGGDICKSFAIIFLLSCTVRVSENEPRTLH